MTALLTRPAPRQAATTRRHRIDSTARPSEVTPESLYLRRWAARQASRYQDLLQTIAALALVDRHD
jgi:hypothetical protein